MSHCDQNLRYFTITEKKDSLQLGYTNNGIEFWMCPSLHELKSLVKIFNKETWHESQRGYLEILEDLKLTYVKDKPAGTLEGSANISRA